MLDTSNFRPGLKLKIDKDLYVIIDFQHSKTARGKANVWTKLKNVRTGQVIERTYGAGERFEQPDFENKTMQYLYSDPDGFHFMDSKTYDQVQLMEEQVGDYKWYLQENLEYDILYFEGNPINVEMPSSVILEVTEAEPAVKGDSVSNIMKNAKVETGLNVKVPLFIKEGDKIKIDTREGKYLERVKE